MSSVTQESPLHCSAPVASLDGIHVQSIVHPLNEQAILAD